MQSPDLSPSPSLNSYSSASFAEIADKITGEITNTADPPLETGNGEEELVFERNLNENEPEDDDFEFGSIDSSVNSFDLSFADEIFYNGQIRPLFQFQVLKNPSSPSFSGEKPVNDEERDQNQTLRLPLRKLFFEEHEPSGSSSESDELETIPEGTYCVWTPKSPARETCKKSSSTGSSKRWKFKDLLIRSNSDGKEHFVFFTPKKEEKPVNPPENGKKTGKAKVKPFSGEASPHQIHYVRNRAMAESDRRKSYLPYRQDLVGIFKTNMNSRNLHPFSS